MPDLGLTCSKIAQLVAKPRERPKSSVVSITGFLVPFGIHSGRERVEVRQKGNSAPNFFIRDISARCIRGKLARPGKHSGISHASLHDPKSWYSGLRGGCSAN